MNGSRSLPRRRLRFVPLLLLPALAAAMLVGSASPAAGRTADGTTAISSAAVHNLALATLTGPLADSTPVSVGVVLQNPNDAAETAYIKSLYDPSSSNYQQFLDSDQFNAQFGVPAAATAAAQAWLSGSGLSVTQVDGATNYLVASGTAAQVSAAFGTPLNDYVWNGHSFYANAFAPSVPASVPVAGIVGLNDFARFAIPDRSGATQPPVVTSSGSLGVTTPNTGLLHPRDLWSIYDQPSTNLGNGQAMAIIGWGVTTPVVPDLRAFEAENKLPAVPVSIRYFGDASTPDTNDGGTVEWELDTQASTGMAPNVASETLYFAHHNTDADILAALAGWVNDKRAPRQASASFGECENVGGVDAILTDTIQVAGDAILKQAVAEGRTLFASTGDNGSSCNITGVDTNGLTTQVYPGQEFPAVSPYVVAVGGTVLTSDGGSPPNRQTETGWEFGGGGNSISEPAGAYQLGTAPTNCTTDESGNVFAPGIAAGPPCRSVPDVAAMSGDVLVGNGMLITDDSGVDQLGGGTSLSSPLWLGMWTRIQAAATAKGKGLGFANYPLYKIATSDAYHNAFYDVIAGDNQPYPAKPGYDNVTGWGSPDVSHLMQLLTGRLTPVSTAKPAPLATFSTTSCSNILTDATGDDNYDIEGQAAVAQPGQNPQLDITSLKMLLSPDGKTLRVITTVANMSSAIPTPGVENDYNVVWSYNGVTYFAQLAVEPGGVVNAYDGQLVHASLESRYQQLNVDNGSITLGPNGTAEVDVPLADVGSPPPGAVLPFPTAQTYVRAGVLAGSLQPVDATSAGLSYLVGGC
ncbi:MAG: S53 family peptidase [Gaiellaceae bacterium]